MAMVDKWINAKESLPPMWEGSQALSIDVRVKSGTLEGLGVYDHRIKFWSTEPPIHPARVSQWRLLRPEELPTPRPPDSLTARAKKMREEFVRQAEFMGGAATIDQLIDVLGLIIEIQEEVEAEGRGGAY